MKKLLILGSLLVFANVAAARDIILSNGESFTLGSTRVFCGGQSAPTQNNSYTASSRFSFNGQNFQSRLNGQNSYVENLVDGSRYKLGCCLLKPAKAIVFGDQVIHIGVGTNRALYYQAGLADGTWKLMNGTLMGDDDFEVLELENSVLLFGMGTNGAFYAAELDRSGTLLGGRWMPLEGSGQRIVRVRKIGADDFRITVIGKDGLEYSRTRGTRFVRD